MLENFMGPENFRKGVSNFLRKYQFKNAVTQDLWDELSSVTSRTLDVSRIMDTWTRQMGYPVLNVKTTNNDPVSFSFKSMKKLSMTD